MIYALMASPQVLEAREDATWFPKGGSGEPIPMPRLIESRHAHKHSSTHVPATTLNTQASVHLHGETIVVSTSNRVLFSHRKGWNYSRKRNEVPTCVTMSTNHWSAGLWKQTQDSCVCVRGWHCTDQVSAERKGPSGGRHGDAGERRGTLAAQWA